MVGEKGDNVKNGHKIFRTLFTYFLREFKTIFNCIFFVMGSVITLFITLFITLLISLRVVDAVLLVTVKLAVILKLELMSTQVSHF